MANFLRLLADIGPMRRYLEGRLQAARETGGEGLIAELVRVEREGGRISSQEMVAMVFLLLGAGSETTAHLISGSVYELLTAPKWRDWLEEDWSRATLAVEEFLRFVSPVQFTKPRIVRRDVELGGVRLKKGQRIMAMLAAANMILRPTRIPRRSILRGSPIGTCHSAPGSTFAWGTSLRVSRAGARWRRFSSDGRSSNSPCRESRFAGGSGPVSGPSKCFRSQRRPAPIELLRRCQARHTDLAPITAGSASFVAPYLNDQPFRSGNVVQMKPQSPRRAKFPAVRRREQLRERLTSGTSFSIGDQSHMAMTTIWSA